MTTPEAAPVSSNEQGPATTPNPDSPGRRLQHARETRSLDVNYVATALRLTPQVVESLERDDYSRLPSAVFVSGYIRSYARLMGIDPEPLNQQFRHLHPEAEAPPRHFARPEQDLKDRDGSNPTLYLITALIVLAVAAAAYLWWSNRPQTEPATLDPLSSESTTPTDTAAPSDSTAAAGGSSPLQQPTPGPATPDADADVQPSAEAVAAPASEDNATPDSAPSPAEDSTETSESAPATPAAADAAGAPSQAPTAETTAEPASAPTPDEDAAVADQTESTDETDQAATEAASAEEEPAPTPESDSVDLAFTGPCWVDIRDAKGSVLLFGEMARGDKQTLAGEPPFSLVIGNAAAVEMTVGGTPYDVRAVARGNVARFEIDPRNLDAATPTSETTD